MYSQLRYSDFSLTQNLLICLVYTFILVPNVFFRYTYSNKLPSQFLFQNGLSYIFPTTIISIILIIISAINLYIIDNYLYYIDYYLYCIHDYFCYYSYCIGDYLCYYLYCIDYYRGYCLCHSLFYLLVLFWIPFLENKICPCCIISAIYISIVTSSPFFFKLYRFFDNINIQIL